MLVPIYYVCLEIKY